MQRIAEADPDRVVLRVIDRERHPGLAAAVRLNGGGRVPVAVFLSEDFEWCGAYGERTLSRYRAIARRQLRAGVRHRPGPAGGRAEMADTLQDWLDEVERGPADAAAEPAVCGSGTGTDGFTPPAARGTMPP